MRLNQWKRFVGVWGATLAAGTWITPAARAGIQVDDKPLIVVVEEDSLLEQQPTVQMAVDPTLLYAEISILSESELPSGWVQTDAVIEVRSTPESPAETFVLRNSTSVMAVVFFDGVSQALRFGVGIQSDVEISVQEDEARTFKASAFNLVTEVGSASLALEKANEMTEFFVQAVPPTGVGPNYYAMCVDTCLRNSYDSAFKGLMGCLGVVTGIGTAAVSACVYVCVYAGPGAPACIAACLEPILIPETILTAACVAGFIAVVTASLAACSLGCIGCC